MSVPAKLVVSHEGALRSKYGPAGLRRIHRALDALAKADAKRGIDTAIDLYGGKAHDARVAKREIDRRFEAHGRPDYLVLIGAPDVVPHVALANPTQDEDPRVPSDLPYACDAEFGATIADFHAPSRVVGRIPGVRGEGDPAPLLRLLDAAAKARPRASIAAGDHLGVTARVWKRSTAKSLAFLFGRSAGEPFVSPPAGPPWKNRALGKRVLLVNCHGAERDPGFYGEWPRGDYPVALLASDLSGKIVPGAVAAFECCYGAELYAPSRLVPPGMANTFLDEGGLGLVGSTTIAYGPAATNDDADLLCAWFLAKALAGASLGRALLEARLEYVKASKRLDPYELKTLAQFLLLGDPSTRLVRPRAARGKGAAGAIPRNHAAHRKALSDLGRKLLRTTSSAVATPGPVEPRAKLELQKLATKKAIEPDRFLAWSVRTPPGAKSAPREAFHAAVSRPRRGKTGPYGTVVLLTRTRGGRIVSVKTLYAR